MAFFSDLQRRAWEKKIPLNVTIELTQRCNLRCRHCYNFDRDAARLPVMRDELSDEEILRVIGEVADAGCLNLTFTGGEALLHPRLLDFVRAARARALLVVVKTNGTLLPSMAEPLARAGARTVEVSVHGADAATHDAFVQAPGSFERAIAGIRAAVAAGLRVGLSYSVVRANVTQVAAARALAASLGVRIAFDPQMTARYDGTRSSLDLRLDGAALESLYRGALADSIPPAATDPRRGVQCSCARSVAAITATGEVWPCIGAPLPSGSIRERSFAEVWRESPELNRIRGLTLDDFGTCRDCDHRLHCRRSSGVMLANTGEYTGPMRFGDDLTCVEAEVLHRLHDEGFAGTAAALRRHSIDE